MDGCERLAKEIFRRTPAVTVTAPDGRQWPGRGVVCPGKTGAGELGPLRTALGDLPRPTARFVGWLPPPARDALGGDLTQGDRAYRVADLREVRLGDRLLCVRALLEEKGGTEDEDDGDGA